MHIGRAFLLLAVVIVMSDGPGAEAINIRGVVGGLRRRGGDKASKPAADGVQVEGGGGGGRTWEQWAGQVKGHALEGAKNMLASSFASAVGKTVLQPFDSIKTVQQHSKTRLGLLEAASQILSRGGPSALYSGLGPTILGSVPSIAIYFGCYQFFKGQLLPFIGAHASIAAAAG